MFGLPDFAGYLIAGAIGAYGISVCRWFAEKYIKDFPDIPLLLGRIIDWGKPEPKKIARVMGRALHLGTGALWGFIFGKLVENGIFFSNFGLLEGVLFSILPWVFFMVVLMPLAKGGIFGIKIGRFQWLIALGMHIVFGSILGLFLQAFL